MQAELKETQADVRQTQAVGKQTQADGKQMQADMKQLLADVADIKADVAWIRGTLEERARNEVNAHNAKTRLGMWIFGGIATLSALASLLQWLFSVRPSP